MKRSPSRTLILDRNNPDDDAAATKLRTMTDADKRAVLRAVALLHSYEMLTDEVKKVYESTVRSFGPPERAAATKKVPAGLLKDIAAAVAAGIFPQSVYDEAVKKAKEINEALPVDEWVSTPKLRVQLDALLAEVRGDFPDVFKGSPAYNFDFLLARVKDYHAYAGYMKAALAPQPGRTLTEDERDDIRSEIARARAVANRIGVYLNRRFANDENTLARHAELFDDAKKTGEARGASEFGRGSKATPRPNTSRRRSARDNESFTLSARDVTELQRRGVALNFAGDGRDNRSHRGARRD